MEAIDPLNGKLMVSERADSSGPGRLIPRLLRADLPGWRVGHGGLGGALRTAPPPVPPDKLCCLHGPRTGQASGSRCRLWQGRGTEVLGSPAHTPAPKQQSPDLPPSGLTLLVKDHWLCRPQRQSGPSQKCTLMPGEGGLGKPGGQVLFLQFLQIMFL